LLQFSFLRIEINLWLAYLLGIGPPIAFVIACFNCKSETQIKFAAILSTVYGVVMISIIVGAISRILNSSIISPTSLILLSLASIFLVGAVLHPREFHCLIPSMLYFLCLPAAFVFLNLYAIINLNNVSWGTRETKSVQQANANSISNQKGFVSGLLGLMLKAQNVAYNQDKSDSRLYRNLMRKVSESLRNIESKLENLNGYKLRGAKARLRNDILSHELMQLDSYGDGSLHNNNANNMLSIHGEASNCKCEWIDHCCLKESKRKILNEKEEKFFKKLIESYLQPSIDEEKHRQEEINEELKILRNNCSYAFLILNGFWITLLFTMQLLKFKLVDKIYLTIGLSSDDTAKYEPVNFVFIMIFIVIMVLQFFAMLWHRLLTFLQVIKNTSLTRYRHLYSSKKVSQPNLNSRNAHENPSFQVDLSNEIVHSNLSQHSQFEMIQIVD
jgi:chitin synthase